ncbi:COMM domain-containing protein 5-like [Tropilaelaps mercedesae]|uniref:COMM domain-containing protein 5 n=1 Tax=Tropilaelaps mercedesae TaxID=418985 RepID=A0A1V9XMW5_9ACAR|nr:COMM domain-containing protein 5-like [Tropilaelaps mercedesae]
MNRESVLFFSGRIPLEVAQLSNHLQTIDRPTFRGMVKLLITEFEGRDVTPQMYSRLRVTSKDPQAFDGAFSGLHRLIRAAVNRDPVELTPEEFKKDLQQLKISNDFANDLTNAVLGGRSQELQKAAREAQPKFDGLEKVDYKIDVTVTSDSSNGYKRWTPYIILSLKTTSGEMLSGEVSIEEFHRLRHGVAQALKLVDVMENRLEGR